MKQLRIFYPLKFTLILNPAFALVSINMIPNSRDLASPSSIDTCLFDHQNNIIKTIFGNRITIAKVIT